MFSFEIYEIFRNNFFYRTPLLWWLLLAVNYVNNENIHWKLMLPRKKLYTWTVLLRLVFLGNEYSSEFFQTLLAVSHFMKNPEAVVQGCSVKTVFLKISRTKCFPENFAKFRRISFFMEHLRWLLLKSWEQKQSSEGVL